MSTLAPSVELTGFQVEVHGADPELFQLRWRHRPHPGRVDSTLEVTYTGTVPVAAGVSVLAGLPAAGEPHWLIPGLFYGENRTEACTRLYPRYARGAPELERFTADRWGFRADRAATPVVFAFTAEAGLALATTETSALGLAGIGFADEPAGPVLRLSWPYREEPVSYNGSHLARPAETPYHDWRPEETVRLSFTCYALGPDRHGYAAVLRDLHARTPAPAAPVAWMPAAEAADLTAEGLYRWHYVPAEGVLLETAAFDREALGSAGDRPAMHVAWVSGAPYAYALLAHGRRRGEDRYADAGAHVLDTICGNLAPAGTFWGQWTRDRGWTAGWTPDPHRLHARTLAEAALFVTRAVASERRRGLERSNWAAAARSTLDVAVAAQRADGHPGSAYHAETGEVLSWDGAAGLAWVPALVEAAALFGAPHYLAAARRAGAYYRGFVEAEFLHGAPEDVDLAPTSEDGYVAVMAYVALYEATGDLEWLDLACRAADWMLTFRYSYDVDFSPETMLGRYGFRSRGADQASPANQHLHAYGLICLPEMARLARHAADPYYLAVTRENLACFRQFVARRDGDFNAYRGMVTERYYQTDCFQAKGMLLTLSHAWCAGVLLYACDAAADLPELAE
jgi:hypothetical protein